MDTSVSALREVFNLLDTEAKGYITVDQFRTTLEQFYQSNDRVNRKASSQRVDSLVKALDPQDDGIIYFDDFTKAFNEMFAKETPEGLSPLESDTNTFSGAVSSKSGGFSDGIENKTDDSGVHINDPGIYDFDNESSLSMDGAQNHLQRDENRQSWPKHSGNRSYVSQLHNIGSPSSISRSDINVDYGELDSIRTHYLVDQMRRMEDRVETLQSSQFSGTEARMNSLREENARLSAHTTILEERLREAELRGQRNVESERQHSQTIINRNQQQHATETDTLRSRISQLEHECGELRIETVQFKANKHEFSSEHQRDSEALLDAQDQIKTLQQQLSTIESKHRTELDTLEQDRDHALHVIEELNTSMGGRRKSRVGSIIGSSDLMSRFHESQEIVRRLLTENKALRIQLEDVNDQLFARSIEEGRNLIDPKDRSWAAEIDTLTKEEVVELWTIEKVSNEQLRRYIDQLTIRILERYPSLLEVS